MEEEFHLISEEHLLRLKKLLNYHISTVILFFLSMYAFFFIFIAYIAALIFTPYALYVVHKEKKTEWIIFFIIIVVVPLITLIVIVLFDPFLKPMLFISLALFYLYFFLLRFAVDDWVTEIRAKNQYLIEKHRRHGELNDFRKNFE